MAGPPAAAGGLAAQPRGHHGLAHPRRTGDEHRPAAAATSLVQQPFQCGHLVTATDHRRRLVGARRLGQAIEERIPQRDRLLTGADAKLALQGPLHPLELSQRRPAIAPRRVIAHQREVGLGIGRIGLEQVRPAPGLP